MWRKLDRMDESINRMDMLKLWSQNKINSVKYAKNQPYGHIYINPSRKPGEEVHLREG